MFEETVIEEVLKFDSRKFLLLLKNSQKMHYPIAKQLWENLRIA